MNVEVFFRALSVDITLQHVSSICLRLLYFSLCVIVLSIDLDSPVPRLLDVCMIHLPSVSFDSTVFCIHFPSIDNDSFVSCYL